MDLINQLSLEQKLRDPNSIEFKQQTAQLSANIQKMAEIYDILTRNANIEMKEDARRRQQYQEDRQAAEQKMSEMQVLKDEKKTTEPVPPKNAQQMQEAWEKLGKDISNQEQKIEELKDNVKTEKQTYREELKKSIKGILDQEENTLKEFIKNLGDDLKDSEGKPIDKADLEKSLREAWKQKGSLKTVLGDYLAGLDDPKQEPKLLSSSMLNDRIQNEHSCLQRFFLSYLEGGRAVTPSEQAQLLSKHKQKNAWDKTYTPDIPYKHHALDDQLAKVDKAETEKLSAENQLRTLQKLQEELRQKLKEQGVDFDIEAQERRPSSPSLNK